jgi:hypothetical protein
VSLLILFSWPLLVFLAVVAYYKGLAPLNAILSSDDIGCMFLLVVLRGEIFPDEG